VGNYGVAKERCESGAAHVRGVVMREARGPDWTGWLERHGIVALTGVDTRSLVLHLRDRGAMRAAISSDAGDLLAQIREQPSMQGRSLVAQVSTPVPYSLGEPGVARIAVIDYGCKRSILRRLVRAG